MRATRTPVTHSEDGRAFLDQPPRHMVWVPGGTFLMGSNDFYPERPVRRVTLDGFWIDEHPVTNAEFRRFVKATGYRTVAELAPIRPTIRVLTRAARGGLACVSAAAASRRAG